MSERIIEEEGDSLEEARKKLYRDDLIVFEETVLCPGKVEIIEVIADSVEEALLQVTSRISAQARIETQEIRVAPKRAVLRAKGDHEESVREQISLGRSEVIESISLHKKGRKGLWGFFKSQNVYDVAVFHQAVLDVTIREKARLKGRVQDYLARDLLQRIEQIGATNEPWTQILLLLNPKSDLEIQAVLARLENDTLIDLATALSIIESVCRADEGANWQIAIKEAHKVASDTRIQLWVEFRQLDADLADVFMFYTSVDRDPKYPKEPSGIPMHRRTGYGRHFPGDQYREVIPYYSTNKEAFGVIERRAKEFGALGLAGQFLQEQGIDEATATLNQMCNAILKARKSQLEGDR